MSKNILKYLGGAVLALGLSFGFFAQPAKAMPGSLTQWLDACTMPGSCSTWTYGSTNGLSVPQGGWLQIRMHNRWVTSPGQLPLNQDGFTVSDIIMDWGYTCPTGLSCYMLPYYASGVTPWTVNGKNYNYLAWDSVSNQDYSPVVTFNTSAATPPGTYRVYFTVFENPSMTAPAAMPPNSGCQFPAPGCLGPVENYVDITVTSPATNGVCGTANQKTYPAGSTAYSPDTQCAAGVSSNTAFPTAGGIVNWVCNGTGGGSPSGTCSAKQAAPAQCVNITAPDTVTVGQNFSASVTMKNTNNTTWWNNTEAAFKNSVAWYFPNDPYRLGSWSPADNTRWGLTRVDMPMKSIGTSGRYFRIRTPSDTSWVAWREITLYDSAGNRVTPVSATGVPDWRGANYAVGPTGVYDGQGWTVWNSGTYSGTITLDYGRVVDFASLWLLPEQTPNPPNTTHYLEISNDNINWSQIATINAQNLRSDVWYIVDSYAKNGNDETFNFNATAPTTPGTYAFDWNMVHDGVTWFPDASACKKNIIVTAAAPTCGTDNGKTLGATPTNLCGVGTATTPVHNASSPGGWTWQCSSGATPVSCSANEYCANFITAPASAGVCNNVSNTSYTAGWTLAPGTYSVQKFRAGPNLSDVSSGCPGGTCIAALDLPNSQASYALSGLSSNTTYYNRVVPFCTNPDGSTGENVNYKSYVWSCTTSASVNGVCGTANGRNYPSTTTAYAPDTQCTSGTPTNTAFPAVSGSASWTCSGSSGGSGSPTCSATRQAPPCSSLTYLSATSGFSTNAAGPAQSSLSIATNTGFYTFVDYGQANIDSIQAPNAAGAPGCSYLGYSGTVARFLCTSAASAGSYTYRTGTNSGTSSNTCASGPTTMGTVNVSVPTNPTISLNPTSFSFTGTSGGTTPAAQSMTVRNTGNATLNWASSGVPGKPGTWCHVSPASGSLAAGAQQTVSVTVDSPTNVGTFSDCGIRISDPAATNNPQDVSVTYAVAPPAAVCPAAQVSMSSTSIVKGTSAQASAPAGWSGGTFSSSNTSVASVSGTAINGLNLGNANITGSGWTATNGATGCVLTSQAVTVTDLPPPTNLGGVNSGAGMSCGQIKVTWTDNAQGEQGFKVYRNTANNSAAATLVATVPSTSVNTTGTGYSYLDTSPPLQYNVAYYYWVTAYVGAIESGRNSGATGSINNTTCEANLNTSDKDIVSVNGVANNTNTCQNNAEFPANVQFKSGDAVGFSVNLCNSAPASGGEAATSIVIDDTLYNLARVDASKPLTDPAAWNASVDAPLSITSIQVVSGTEPDNLRLRFRLTGSLPAGPGAAKLKFFAKVAFPTNFSGASSRFQNSVAINYVKDSMGNPGTTVNKSTALLLFVKGSGPSKIETSP